MEGREVFAQFAHRNKLVEDPIVKHQQHPLLPWVVLYGKEAFASIVGLLVAHSARGDQFSIGLPIRAKADSTVEEDFERRPDLADILCSSVGKYFLE